MSVANLNTSLEKSTWISSETKLFIYRKCISSCVSVVSSKEFKTLNLFQPRCILAYTVYAWYIILKKKNDILKNNPAPLLKRVCAWIIFKKRLERLWRIWEINRYRDHLRFGIEHIPQKCALCMGLCTESTKLTNVTNTVSYKCWTLAFQITNLILVSEMLRFLFG